MSHQSMLPARSLLFVPANRPDRFQKALDSGADIVCVDLEDAVAAAEKAAARDLVAPFFSPETSKAKCRRALRINSLTCLDGLRDILFLETARLTPDLILLPKTASATEVFTLNRLLQQIGITCPVFAIIESAEGLDNASEIALAPNVIGLCFGSADYSSEAGSSMEWDALVYGRGRIVQAAARAGVLAIDGAWLNIKDEDGLSAESRRLPGLGFDGRVVIHPAQIAAVHQAFRPSDADIARAQKIIEATKREGTSAMAVDGQMVDRPVLLWAERILSRVTP